MRENVDKRRARARERHTHIHTHAYRQSLYVSRQKMAQQVRAFTILPSEHTRRWEKFPVRRLTWKRRRSLPRTGSRGRGIVAPCSRSEFTRTAVKPPDNSSSKRASWWWCGWFSTMITVNDLRQSLESRSTGPAPAHKSSHQERPIYPYQVPRVS